MNFTNHELLYILCCIWTTSVSARGFFLPFASDRQRSVVARLFRSYHSLARKRIHLTHSSIASFCFHFLLLLLIL
jgi:hypothetical protein